VYGYETINWLFIGIFVAYLLISILYKNYLRHKECDELCDETEQKKKNKC
jgi:hypothetical protein